MKFTERYPDAVNPQKRFPQAMLGPHPEVIVAPGVAQTWRVYPCAACKAPTGFRLEIGADYPMVPCCSEECMAELQKPELDGVAVAAAAEMLPEIPHVGTEKDVLWPGESSSLQKLADEVLTDPVLAEID